MLSFNQIEPINKTAYITGLMKATRGRGCFLGAAGADGRFARSGTVRRFVIKCRVANQRSNQVALRNGFTLEGCLKQAEYLNGSYDDQNIYGRIIDCDTGQFPARG